MKRKFSLVVLALVCAVFCALGLAACGDEDNSGGHTPTGGVSVVGQTFVFDRVEAVCDNEEMKEYLAEIEESAKKNMKDDYVAFGVGGACSFRYGGIIVNGTYTQNGSTVTVSIDGKTTDYSVTENSISTTVAMQGGITVTTVYVKGTPSTSTTPEKPEKPEKPEDSSKPTTPTACEHKERYEITDYEEADCKKAGYSLDVWVCTATVTDLSGKTVFCGAVFSADEKETEPMGYLDVSSEYAFKRLVESGEIKELLSDYRTTLQKLPHTPVTDAAVPATCSTKGLTEGSHCNVCNEVIKAQVETDYTDHAYTDVIQYTAAAVVTDNVCTGCGRLEKAGYIFKTEPNGEQAYTLVKGDGWTTLNFGSSMKYNGKPVTAIGEQALKNCGTLTTVDLSGVESVGERAFYGCDGLASLTIPNGVVRIGEYAFYACTSLTSVTIPDSVTDIGGCAFAYCNSVVLKCVAASRPNGWSYNWAYNDNLYQIPIVWNCNNNEVASDGCIHTVIDGIRYALKDGEAKVWAQPYNLQGSVVLPQSVTYKSVTYSVTSIGRYAFSNLDKVTGLTIPESVVDIDEYAFFACEALESITVASGNPNYYSVNDCLIAAKTGTFILGCNNSVIPTDGSVTSIGVGAFSSCKTLTRITIPNSVTSIAGYAFSGCDALTDIYYTGSLSDWCAVSGLENLMTYCAAEKHLYINGVEVSGTLVIPEGVEKIPAGAFAHCDGLTDIVIPASVKQIGEKAFAYCGGLTRIDIPSCVTDISYAFNHCTGLREVILNNSDTEVYSAFQDSPVSIVTAWTHQLDEFDKNALVKVVINGGDEISGYCFAGCANLAEITINNVRSIGNNAFAGCGKLAVVKLGNGLTKIGGSAFINCTALTSIVLPDSVTEVGEIAFNGCTKLLSVDLGDGVRTIASGLFGDCRALTEVKLNDSIGVIEPGAFQGCGSLVSIKLPNALFRLGANAFDGCTKLADIQTGDAIVEIYEDAFKDTAYYADAKNWVKYADVWSVDDDELRSLYVGKYLIEAPRHIESSFTIKSDTLAIAARAFIWSSFYPGIGDGGMEEKEMTLRIPSTVKGIGAEAFSRQYNSGGMDVKLILPDGLQFVGPDAFYDWGGDSRTTNELDGATYLGSDSNPYLVLVSFATWRDTCTIHDDTRFVERSAFNSGNLTTLVIPEKIVSFGVSDGNRIFLNNLQNVYYKGDLASWCNAPWAGIFGSSTYTLYIQNKAITGTLVIPAGVTKIAAGTFEGCDGITKIVLPADLQYMGSNAFSIPSLTEVEFKGTKAQWQALISVSGDWDFNVDHYTVTCSDGVVSE